MCARPTPGRRADRPPRVGNQLTARVGNSVTDNPLKLGKNVTADISKPVFVGLEAAASESGDAWEGFLTGLGERGLACPLLVISDGAAGLIGAVERTMGAALRQRCLVHRARNVLAKVPKNAQAEVKADYWAIFDVPDTIEPGLDPVGYVQKRIDSFEKRWRDAYPAAVRCLLDDRDSLTDGVPAVPA